MMLLSTFDGLSPPFLPLEQHQLGRSEDHEWPVHLNQDAALVLFQPVLHSTPDCALPSLSLSGGRQLDESTENHLWLTRLDEPAMQIDEFEGFDWPELADVTFDAGPDITDKEILRFSEELSDNQAPNQPIAQKEGLSMLVTRPETPSNENEGGSPHKTTFEHSPRSVHHESTATPYPQEEVKEAVKILVVMMLVLGHVVSDNYTPPAAPEYEDALQDLGGHISLRDGHPQEGSEVVHDLKRKRKGHTQRDRSPKRPKHHAPPSQIQRTRHKGSAMVRFDSAIYLENSTQQQTFQWIRRKDIKWKVLEERYKDNVFSCFYTDPGSLSIYVRPEAGDKVCIVWDETKDIFVGTDVPGGRIYEAEFSEMERLLKNPGQSIELKYWKRY
ncbi:hypothetical protein F4824DRAFT_500947 [Ustulina deusta]|nr:hypothetical protein F4824DRAFT_500947 [Ustulina deusta]